MNIACIQMNMAFCRPDDNLAAAKALIRRAVSEEAPDVVVLPETWNTGFFPRSDLDALCDHDGRMVQAELGPLAGELHVNIVAGSVSDLREGKLWNTAYVFDRQGRCVARYDKTHLFSPMEEDRYYTPGSRLCRFRLDGVECGLILCYDLRFPELTRALALDGMEVLFVPAQWGRGRTGHLQTLTQARAIENQLFVACCNSCGSAGDNVCGGRSAILDPWGGVLAQAGEQEQIITAQCDLAHLRRVREALPLYRDRREDLYAVEIL